MITSVNYSLFPSDELLTFTRRTIAVTEARKLQLPSVGPYLENAITKCVDFQNALERESKNPAIKLQSESDGVRNDAFIAFRTFCESAAARRKEGWSVAAKAILSVIRKHGWSAHHMGLKSKTATITNIVTELKTKYDAELKQIHADELLDELTSAEMGFEAVAHQVVETASTNTEPTVAETRPAVIVAVRSMLQFINLQQIAAPSSDLTALITLLNELIITSLSTVKASDTRAQNTKKSSTDTTK